MRKIILTLALCVFFSVSLFAENFVVIGHEGKVFDSPNAKGYVTTNQNGDEIILSEGMVFKKKDNAKSGWDMIEYSPGLKGFIMQSLEDTPTNLENPIPGEYHFTNAPTTSVSVQKEGSNWVATIGENRYYGQAHEGAVVFFNSSGDILVSLVTKGGKTWAYTYKNDITKFF